MDISQSNWNEADDNNTTAAPDGAPEGMPPSGVNDTLRAMMGAIKRWYDQSIPRTTDGAGSSTAYRLSYDAIPTALADGMTFLVGFDKSCGNAPTLEVNSLGAKPLHKWTSGSWVALVAGDLMAGQIVRLAYDQASGALRILAPLNVVPTGATLGFRGTAAQVPAGWLIERGTSIGDAASGATELASAACEALFKLLWANANYAVQTPAGGATAKGASADADWAAHRRLVLSDMADTFRRGATATPGGTGGAATHSHSVSVSGSGSGTASGTTNGDGASQQGLGGGSGFAPTTSHAHTFSANVSVSVSATGTSGSTSNIPPYVYELSIIKL
ncbi:hypothetical protein [Enhydrobacter sp.]|jgi:hypothetical protein|uniref:hypothetical protein n=1 Tax=Enhydrobacter sp. TaxID=1894999 RepID=UPI00261167C0|nr:hypothetical protein [Enhydrobacter sp.]WIM14486.1 MAG: diguanylate cyclase/phosphodiesterase (GGDEF & EAL domains) with PAS/PAC sensor(s) [Enhydrobacter sp.]